MNDIVVKLQDTRHILVFINSNAHYLFLLLTISFFHRLKLRNDTHFHVNYIHNDLLNMQLESRISLNDLHLIGTYERSMTDKNPSILYYTPTFGQIEFLLKDVQYKMKGRYRLVQERLFIELVISAIKVDDILMSYSNKTTKSPSISLHRRNIEQFLERLKVDLDKWLRDYFNDYLLYIDLAGPASNAKFQEYDKNKALTLNEYVDTALSLMKRRLQKLKATAVKLPMFSIFSTNGVVSKNFDDNIKTSRRTYGAGENLALSEEYFSFEGTLT
ncbi:uncharacterized protein LOC131846843 [Achroia grisella]|uniref:uncharacterized protein LOC131846843 n=1 Tax=Achroia grisella TaxID=688607 RepID=UPI0027D260F1|nr:uncharacterized protein LOC131846843 [Achroia grisella]